jgi:16S rRNA (guanine527-N7)-methyltransferase
MGVLAVETPQAGQLWIDAGTGGGFPGMVLKICRPELQIVLLDSSQKKTAFLISTGEAMGLADLDVVCSRMEEPFAVKRRIADQSFDVVLMKAVAPLIRVIAWANSLCHPGSRLLVFKGPQWKQEVEQSRELMQRSRWAFEDLTQIPWSHSKILRLRKQ